MSRQTARPRPVPPSPEASGPVFVEKKGSKMRRRFSGAMPIPRSITLSSASRPPGSGASLSVTDAAVGHGLTGVDQQVDQHLLDLGGVHPCVRPAQELHLQPDLVPRQVLAGQKHDFFREPIQVHRGAVIGVAARPRQAEHPTRDRRGSLAGLEDPRECAVAIGRIGIPQTELGVVDESASARC